MSVCLVHVLSVHVITGTQGEASTWVQDKFKQKQSSFQQLQLILLNWKCMRCAFKQGLYACTVNRD
jgi:hypothetical protein